MCENMIYLRPSTKNLLKYGYKYCSHACKGKHISSQELPYGSVRRNKNAGNNPYVRKVINGVRVKLHRYIMEQHLGRKLNRKEVVHHINGNPKDNRIENLQVMSLRDHSKLESEISKTFRNPISS